MGPESKLRGYGGRGPLRAWLRMVATRRSLNARRGDGRRQSLEDRAMREVTAGAHSPAIGLVVVDWSLRKA